MATTQTMDESTFATIESTFATMDMNSEPTTVVIPYRSLRTDNSDKKYADQLRKDFEALSFKLRSEFDKFTKNLMKEEYISRNCLLDATDDFYNIHFELCSGSMAWCIFTNNAFNYRPYQMW